MARRAQKTQWKTFNNKLLCIFKANSFLHEAWPIQTLNSKRPWNGNQWKKWKTMDVQKHVYVIFWIFGSLLSLYYLPHNACLWRVASLPSGSICISSEYILQKLPPPPVGAISQFSPGRFLGMSCVFPPDLKQETPICHWFLPSWFFLTDFRFINSLW